MIKLVPDPVGAVSPIWIVLPPATDVEPVPMFSVSTPTELAPVPKFNVLAASAATLPTSIWVTRSLLPNSKVAVPAEPAEPERMLTFIALEALDMLPLPMLIVWVELAPGVAEPILMLLVAVDWPTIMPPVSVVLPIVTPVAVPVPIVKMAPVVLSRDGDSRAVPAMPVPETLKLPVCWLPGVLACSCTPVLVPR